MKAALARCPQKSFAGLSLDQSRLKPATLVVTQIVEVVCLLSLLLNPVITTADTGSQP